MNSFQICAVVICILLNALDGFDVLAISFASPGIASEWGINRAALGVVLAAELVGMAIGSITLGNIADSIGRRPTILWCLVLMTAGMYTSSLVNSVNVLVMTRLVTGVGIGGMLASTNAMTAEFSNAKYRSLAVMVMATGFPLGAIIGGSISTQLLATFDWRAIFEFGALCTGFFILVVWIGLPESVEYLATRRPPHALQRINKTLERMGHEALAALPEPVTVEKRASYSVLFSPKYRSLTLLLMVAYFMHIMTFYYILKWIPKIVVDMGYQASLAGSVLVWANVGGALGALVMGIVSTRVRLRKLLTVMLVISFFMVSVFGLGHEDLAELSLIAAVTGFFTNASVVGFYALMAASFPADVRASGTGVVIGVGRGGAAMGPVIAGLLFVTGMDLLVVSIVMGAGAAIAAGAIFSLRPVLKRHDIAATI
ncbi:MFS transporter [Pseudomaricurvus alkylphenolicus]|nr:MFS transporter [Pseudomaricurvus alkylphenolicus]